MKFKNEGVKLFVLPFAICYLLFAICGCATVADIPKGILGISTRVLEDSKKDAIKKNFKLEYNTCFEMTQDILKHMGAYSYAQSRKKKMIAVYVSETDTTPVGIFFTETGLKTTLIEVSSPSIYGKEFVSKNLFLALDKALMPKEIIPENKAKNLKTNVKEKTNTGKEKK